MSDLRYHPNVPKRPTTSPAQAAFYKVAGAAVVLAILMMLWKTGVLASVQNFVTGLYSSGASAVSQSQQNFGSNIAKRRKHTETKELGGSTGG